MRQDNPKPTGSAVPRGASRDGETVPSARWGWIERAIWTDRMVSALANGVQGGKWFSLIDKIASAASLSAAWQQVRRKDGAGGIDGVTIGQFDRAHRRILPKLSQRLVQGDYVPQPVRRVEIPKPGQPGATRPLGIPTVIDRVVQQATRSALEPIFEIGFHPNSYGFRPGRSAHDALHHVVRELSGGRWWVVDADLKSFFDTIDHDQLLALIETRVSDGSVLSLLRQMLQAGVVEAGELFVPSDLGTPQGGVISPLLANIYLDALDHVINASGHVLIRYADDFVILCRSESEALSALETVREWTAERRLELHPEKTRLVDMTQDGASFAFLGFELKRRTDRRTGKPRIIRLPRASSVKKFRSFIRAETRRANGRSLEETITRINQRVRGWGRYFQSAIRNELDSLDKWIRMRLRSILRKRSKRKGRGRGRDHNRWPNAFFLERGLVSLASLATSSSPPKPG